MKIRAISSAVEHLPYKEIVTGSIPVWPISVHQACDRSSRCIKRSELYPLFCHRLRDETDNCGRAMGKQKLHAKVRSTGVEEFKPDDGSWA